MSKVEFFAILLHGNEMKINVSTDIVMHACIPAC